MAELRPVSEPEGWAEYDRAARAVEGAVLSGRVPAGEDLIRLAALQKQQTRRAPRLPRLTSRAADFSASEPESEDG